MNGANRELKAALVLRFGNQAEAAQCLGLQESRISRIIHGRISPSKKDRAAFVRVFGADKITALFGNGAPGSDAVGPDAR